MKSTKARNGHVPSPEFEDDASIEVTFDALDLPKEPLKPEEFPDSPVYQYPEYIRVKRKLDAERGWQAWCDYKYTDMFLNDILEKYDITVPTLYATGKRFGDNFRRGRGRRLPLPLSKAQMKEMYMEYLKGEISLHKLEEKYGIGSQWLYKLDDGQKQRRRRRPDSVPRDWKCKLSKKDELEAWNLYEYTNTRVEDIIDRFKINKSTLYDIGDRLGSTFRRHRSSSGDAVVHRGRYVRNQRGL